MWIFCWLLKVTDEQSKIQEGNSSAHILDKKERSRMLLVPVGYWSNLLTWKKNNLGGLSHLRFSARIHD
jgi:hypothetical protein